MIDEITVGFVVLAVVAANHALGVIVRSVSNTSISTLKDITVSGTDPVGCNGQIFTESRDLVALGSGRKNEQGRNRNLRVGLG